MLSSCDAARGDSALYKCPSHPYARFADDAIGKSMSRRQDHRDLGRRWGVSATPTADDAIDHYHADTGNIAKLNAVEQVASG